jgi:hypothetical protein
VTSDHAEVLTELDELDALRAEFPAYLFWREQLPGRVRYAARTPYLEVHPHTVVTGDLAELGRALAFAREPGSSPLAAVLPVQPRVAWTLGGQPDESVRQQASRVAADPVTTVVPEAAGTATVSLAPPTPGHQPCRPAPNGLPHCSQLSPGSGEIPESRSAMGQSPQAALDGAGAGQAQRGLGHRRGVLDLIWKIDSRGDRWSATLRTDRRMVVTAADCDELARRTRDLTLAILEGHGAEALHAMRSAGAA